MLLLLYIHLFNDGKTFLFQESTEAVSPDTSLSDISSRLEVVVKNLLEKLREHDLDELKASLIEDQVRIYMIFTCLYSMF